MQTMNRSLPVMLVWIADHLRIEGLTTAELERMERLAESLKTCRSSTIRRAITEKYPCPGDVTEEEGAA